MNPPSEDIKDMIAAESALALTFADDLHVGQMPETPDACVCVYDTPGDPPQSGYEYLRPGIQVKVRGAMGKYRDAHLLAQSIRNLLHDDHNHTINSARYVGIWAQGDVMALGPDEHQRPQFTVNFRIHRTTAS